MSRSGYSDDYDTWDWIRWRDAIASAIRGKRGQRLLLELEAALLALPEKNLCAYDFANPSTGQVCALGAVALKRRVDKGASIAGALREIAEKFPEDAEAEVIADEIGVADAMVKEITWVNDEDLEDATPERRYQGILEWVRSNIEANRRGKR